MTEKLKGLLSQLLNKIPEVKGGSVKVILALSAIYIIIVGLFLFGWVANWKADGKADLKIMIELLQVLTGPAALAAFAFVSKGFVDKNKNGVPDEFEDKTP